MSYSQQDVFQIINLVMSSIYIVLVSALVSGMENVRWYGLFSGLTSLFRIAARDVKTLFRGETAEKGRPASRTEMYVSWVAVILACGSFSFYWASVGTNLSNGTPNAFTTYSSPSTQAMYALGTVLIILVVSSFTISLVHWGFPMMRRWCS